MRPLPRCDMAPAPKSLSQTPTPSVRQGQCAASACDERDRKVPQAAPAERSDVGGSHAATEGKPDQPWPSPCDGVDPRGPVLPARPSDPRHRGEHNRRGGGAAAGRARAYLGLIQACRVEGGMAPMLVEPTTSVPGRPRLVEASVRSVPWDRGSALRRAAAGEQDGRHLA